MERVEQVTMFSFERCYENIPKNHEIRFSSLLKSVIMFEKTAVSNTFPDS